MTDMKTKKDFEAPFTKEEAEKYVQKTLMDGRINSIHITWNFDEAQAGPFHHFWDGDVFMQAVRKLAGIERW